MKEKKFWNVKNIVIGLVSFLLIGASATGVAVFLKDRGEADAVQQGMVENLPITGNDQTNNNQVEENINTNDENVVIPVTPEDNGDNTTGETEATGNTGTTSGTGTSSTTTLTEEIVAGITETVVERERKVYEDLELSWTTIAIPAVTADMGIYKPELVIEKTATSIVKAGEQGEVIDLEKLENIEDIPMVRPGDSIIYTIKVSNIGNYKATNVVVTESLDVIFENQKVVAGNPVVTIETLDYGKVAILKVAYEVTQKDIDATEIVDGVEAPKNIENKVSVTDGKTTEEDKDDTVPVNPDIEDITVTKTWMDNNNQDGIRPTSIAINLLADGEKVQSKTITEKEGWKWTFTNLPKYAEDGKEIVYTIEEEEVADYTTSINGYDVTNTHTLETVEVTGSKIWDDNDNQDGKRPTSITINLLANGTAIDSKTITEADDWKWEFKDLPKYANGKEIKYTITENAVDGYQAIYSNDTFTITNIYKSATASVTVYKEWVTPHVMTHPDIHIQLYQNGVAYGNQITLSAGTDGVWEQSDLQYTWTNLPKYELNNGELVIENGVVQLNQYTVKEVDVVAGVENLIQYITTYSDDIMPLNEAETTPDKTITNTAKGIVETVTYLAEQTTYTKPVDVVLVLDTSGSMAEANSQGNSKAKDMVTAVNETITTIMSHNPLSKVAVVTYSNSATTILPLGTYTPNTEGQYLTCSQGSWSSWNGKYSNVSISTNVEELGTQQNTVQVTGATYIQGGIAQGANILIGADTAYDPDGAEGAQPATTRIPIFILLSDGEPTKRTTNYDNVGASNGGSGSNSTYLDAYYTILTADAYRTKIKEHYGNVNFYTIGYGADSLLLRTVLNPDADNIDECKISKRRSETKKLYDELEETTEGAYGFDYADGSYTSGTMSSTELSSLLNHFIHSSVPSTTYRIFTREEIEKGKVYLYNIDTTDGFSLTYGNKTYLDLEDAKNHKLELVKQDPTNNELYLDLEAVYMDLYDFTSEEQLQNVVVSEQIYVKYHEKKSST